MRLVAFGLVCFYLSFAFASSSVNASAFSSVVGATIPSPTSPIVTASGSSYVFSANDPRVSFPPPASSYPVPKSVVSKTFPSASWRPYAMSALRASGASFALFFAADQICSQVNCVDLVWGENIKYQGSSDGIPVFIDSVPLGWGSSTYRFCNSSSPSLSGFACLNEYEQQEIRSRLSMPWCFEVGHACIPVRFMVTLGTPPSQYYQYQFRVAEYHLIDSCPSPYVFTGSGCSSPSESVPFDESLFDDAVAVPNLSAEASELNQALWNLLDSDSVIGDIFLDFEPVVETTTETVTSPESVPQTIESIVTYEFPVSNNNSPAPSVSPLKTTQTNIYQSGNLVDSVTNVETGSSSGGLPPEPPIVSRYDCDFFPTLCEWLSWFKDYEEPEPIDYSEIIRDDFEPVDYVFDVPSGSCPEPIVIDIGILGGTVDFSFDLICEYAETIRYFVLMSAYLLSALLIFRSIK